MLIYRVECKDRGLGMYTTACRIPWDNCLERNPSSYEDMRGQYHSFLKNNYAEYRDVRHGFDSVDMMYNWMHKDIDNVRKLLAQSQLHIAIYEVPDEYVCIGKCQVIFLACKGKKVGTFSEQEYIDWVLGKVTPEVSLVSCDFINIPIKDMPMYPVNKNWMRFKEAPRSARKYA